MSFDDIAGRYARDSTAQRRAAELLLALAEVAPSDDVLDVGCGTGAFLARLRAATGGRVVGVDPSPRMIDEARKGAPARVRRALRPGGRTVIQAPATARYAPEFVDAMEDVARDAATRDVFATWRSPWLWLETAEAYAALLAAAGFDVRLARIDELASRETPDGALRIYGSGAEAGYLGAACYPAPLPAGYAERVRALVRDHLARRAGADGKLDVRFRRVFLAAVAR